MEKEFLINDKIDLPISVTFHKIDDAILIIEPKNPNWIVLSQIEYELYDLLKNNISIKKALEYCLNNSNYSESILRNNMQFLLEKIEQAKFYEEQISITENNPENIKKNIHVYLTHKCNLHCSHCYVGAGNEINNELNIDKWYKTIDKLEQHFKYSEIVFSGGEPLIKKGFFEINVTTQPVSKKR